MEPLLKAKDLAEILNLSENTIYQLTYRDAIPYVKFGKTVRFRESEILQWIEKNSHGKITLESKP